MLGYRLSVPEHRSVQLSNLEVWLLTGVWVRLAVIVGSVWAGLTLLATAMGSEDWLFLSVALFSVLVLDLVTMSIIFTNLFLPSSSRLYIACWSFSQILYRVFALKHCIPKESFRSPSLRIASIAVSYCRSHAADLLGSVSMMKSSLGVPPKVGNSGGQGLADLSESRPCFLCASSMFLIFAGIMFWRLLSLSSSVLMSMSAQVILLFQHMA